MLTLFTTEDYIKILDIFELNYSLLEDTGNIVYQSMLELEKRQVRVGVDFVTQVRDLIFNIESLTLLIEKSKTSGEPSNIKAEEITGELRVEYGADPQGNYGGVTFSYKEQIKEYKKKLNRILSLYNLPNSNKLNGSVLWR